METKQIYVVNGQEYSDYSEALAAETKLRQTELDNIDIDTEIAYYERRSIQFPFPRLWHFSSHGNDSYILIESEAMLMETAGVLLKFAVETLEEWAGSGELDIISRKIVETSNNKAAAGFLISNEVYESKIKFEAFDRIDSFK